MGFYRSVEITVMALIQKPLGPGQVPEFLLVLEVSGRFPSVFGRFSNTLDLF